MTSLLAFEVRGGLALFVPGLVLPQRIGQATGGGCAIVDVAWRLRCGWLSLSLSLSLGWHVILVRKVQRQWRAVDDIRAGLWRDELE